MATVGTETARQRGALAGGARRVAATTIAAVMLLFAFSLWTVIPFGWIWIGSKLSSSQAPSAGPYMLVFFGKNSMSAKLRTTAVDVRHESSRELC